MNVNGFLGLQNPSLDTKFALYDIWKLEDMSILGSG